jgi:hypothetical protein
MRGDRGGDFRILTIDQQCGARDFQRLALLPGGLDEGLHCFWQGLVFPCLKKRPKFGNVAPFLNRSNGLLTVQPPTFIR